VLTDWSHECRFMNLSGTTSLRMAKASDIAEAAVIAAANKQARIEEADTFRGVNLDPNAHHWDEVCHLNLSGLLFPYPRSRSSQRL
jgi:hypothetical protein